MDLPQPHPDVRPGLHRGLFPLPWRCSPRHADGARKNPTPEKDEPYECGSESTLALQHVKPSVKFYLTAILFVVFDIEAIFPTRGRCSSSARGAGLRLDVPSACSPPPPRLPLEEGSARNGRRERPRRPTSPPTSSAAAARRASSPRSSPRCSTGRGSTRSSSTPSRRRAAGWSSSPPRRRATTSRASAPRRRFFAAPGRPLGRRHHLAAPGPRRSASTSR